MPSTEKISIPYHRDAGAAAYRIGLIALDSDIAAEADFHAMLPDDVMFYTTRINHLNPVSIENLKKLGPQLTDASKKLLPRQRLDVIAYSCTSGTVAVGYSEVALRVRNGGRPHVPVATPITAAVAGFKALGVRSISLLTPPPDSDNQSTGRFFEEYGIEVVNIGSFCLDDDIAIAEIPPEAIYAAALETYQQGAGGLFISSTALRAVETLQSIEQTLQKPILSAVQCLFWESLRLGGYSAPVAGFGQLLRI